MNMLTQDRLKDVLDYNSDTGIFIWKTQRANNKMKIGDVAGTINNNGYVQIYINNEQYLAHRLAWLYVYGYLPENIIDHKDRIKHHNWIDNLRETSTQCNIRNSKNYSIGTHVDFDEAVCHRLAAEQCLDWSGCDNNSPAYKHVKENI